MEHNRLLFRRRPSPLKRFSLLGICVISMAFGMFVSDNVDQALANMPGQMDTINAIGSRPEAAP